MPITDAAEAARLTGHYLTGLLAVVEDCLVDDCRCRLCQLIQLVTEFERDCNDLANERAGQVRRRDVG